MLLAGRKFSYIAQEGQQKMGVARNIHISSLAKFAQKGPATQGFKKICWRKVNLKIFWNLNVVNENIIPRAGNTFFPG